MNTNLLFNINPAIVATAFEMLAGKLSIYANSYSWYEEELTVESSDGCVRWDGYKIAFYEDDSGMRATLYTPDDSAHIIFRAERPPYPSNEKISRLSEDIHTAVGDILRREFPEVSHDDSFADSKLDELIDHWIQYNHPSSHA